MTIRVNNNVVGYQEAENDTCSYSSEQDVETNNFQYNELKSQENIDTISKKSSKKLSVTFAEPIVTEVRTRPRTKQKNKSRLYFTREEYMRFRKEYRLYREEKRRLESQASSPLYNMLSFASTFISGLEVRKRESSPKHESSIATVTAERSIVPASDLYDVLYLY